MADIFRLQGSWTTDPITGVPSGDPHLDTMIDESLTLENKEFGVYDLLLDTAYSISFGGVTNANVVIIKTLGGKVKARLTSADGTTQSVPIDSFFVLMSSTVPVTALDVTRVSGIRTIVRVFLGDKA